MSRFSSVKGSDITLTGIQKMSACVEEEDGSESPASSSLSVKSDCSKEDPLDFSDKPGPSDKR